MTEFEIRSRLIDEQDDVGPIAEFRTGLMRATLLFGVIAVAFVLIVLPQAKRVAGADFASVPQLDMMTTGSISPAGGSRTQVYTVQRSVLQDGGPCYTFANGDKRGAC